MRFDHFLQDVAYQARGLKRHLFPWRRKPALEALFLAVNGWLAGQGVEYWIAWGTLLGWHRHSALLPDDRDVDFGVLAPDYPRLVAARTLLPPGFTLHDTSHKHGGPKLYVDHGGWCADLYFHEAEAGGLLRPRIRSRFLADTAPFPASQVLPTREAVLLGAPTRVPAQVEDHLAHCYHYLGEDAVRDPVTGYFGPRKG